MMDYSTALPGACAAGVDDRFGPQVDAACRSLDFTLLFEDAFLVALPAGLYLLLLPARIRSLWRAPVKMASYRLATWKLVVLGLLFVFQLLFLAFRAQAPRLYTRMAVSSDILGAVAVLGSGFQSILEDQRSIKPSDILVLYFSAYAVLSIARLRSLWLIPSDYVPRAMWTAIFILAVLIVVIESARKAKFLRPLYRSATAEQLAGFWDRTFFIWVLPIFRAGHAGIIGLDDMPAVDDELKGESAGARLQAAWARTQGRHRLLRAAAKAYFWPLVSAVIPRVALSAFMFCQPFLIEACVSYIRDGPSEEDKGLRGQALVGAAVLVYTGISVSRAAYSRQTNRFIARVRSGLVSGIYQHTTALRASEVQDSAAITLMGTDVERIVQSLKLFHELWAAILEVSIGIWLLAVRMSYASVMPLFLCLVSVVAVSYAGKSSGEAQTQWVERVQKRVAVTAGMLSDMKAVKMLGLSDVLSDVITKLRTIELKTSERFRGLLVWRILLSNVPSALGPFATFAIYAVIAVSRKDETLLGAQAFSSLSLIALVMHPLNLFCQALPYFFQVIASSGRIEQYFLKPPASDSSDSPSNLSSSSLQGGVSLGTMQQFPRSTRPLATLDNADVSWSPEASEPILKSISMTIQPGLTALVGPVASGKSTLLATLVGETIVKRGSVDAAVSKAALCLQTPWIMDDTIRQNIVAGLDWDENWYRFSLESCGLQDDIDGMPYGDQTVAGSKGASLSGGQRQRVSLARAVYSRLPIVILDDVMSGLDPKTAGIITTHLFSSDGHFRRAGISVILATHSRRVLPYMDSIFVFDNGKLVDSGSYREVNLQAAGLVEQAESESNSETPAGSKDDRGEQPRKEKEKELGPLKQPPAQQTAASGNTNSQRQSGSWSVYSYYYRSAGALAVFLWALFTILEGVSSNIAPIWIQKWTDANEKAPNQQLGLYLGVYAVLVVVATLSVAGECSVFFITVINNTATKLHADLLHSTLRAPLHFFQATDTGSITNRFSQDIDLIDMSLPNSAIQFTTASGSCIVQLLILCVVGRYLAVTIPVLVFLLFFIQRYYLRTSRQVRLLDIEAKAPLYKHYIETVNGVATIRAFSWARGFRKANSRMLDESQKPFYLLFCIQQWLSLVLDLIVGALAVILVAVGTSSAGGVSSGGIGVALVLLLDFNNLLSQSIRAWTALETSIGAVARVQDFVRDTPSEIIDAQVPPLEPEWPSQGAIRLENVVASYGPEASPSLVDVSLSIRPGEKIAICGPSGSGKTSMIMAILRLMDIKGGSITIDRVDVSAVQGDDVRKRLDVVPQEPFFMPGTIRFNLDPTGNTSDSSIEAAIRRVSMWEKVSAQGGLDMELVATEWSHGERQLLCMARALLVKSKILILDEATSSIDEKTEAIIQEVIETSFQEQTVISVLHRLTYIGRFDRVAVLGHGRLLECDSPPALLGRESAFLQLYRAYHSHH